jgi:hypothetical protein
LGQPLDIQSFPARPSAQALFSVAEAVGIAYPGRSRASNPALIIPLSVPLASVAAEVYGKVRLKFYPALDVDAHEQVLRTPAAVLECLDPALVPTFCSLCMDIIARSRSPLLGGEVRRIVSEWRDLLRSQARLSAEAEIGLWGELTLILECPDVRGAVAAWHGPSSATLDFFAGGNGLECKTSRDSHRHQVSLDQARWAEHHQRTYLASLVVVEDGISGKTVLDLIDDVRAHVSGDHLFEKKLLSTGFRAEHAASYETRFSLTDLWLLPMGRVPRVRGVDQGISEVRYSVDLQGVRDHRLDPSAVLSVLSALSKDPAVDREEPT